MDPIKARSLAPLLPLGENDVVFHYSIYLGGGFATESMDTAARVSIASGDLPFQVVQTAKKDDGETWSIGFNVFQEGGNVYYQSFFWKGDPPGKGRLENGNDWHKVGTACTLQAGTGAESTARIPKYDWLTCTTQPVACQFDLQLYDGRAEGGSAIPTPQIVHQDKFTNMTQEPISYSPKVTYSCEQKAETTVTDTHTFQAGLDIEWEGEVGMFVASSKLTIGVSLDYETSHETTSMKSTTTTFTIEEPVSLTVNPGATKYISVVLLAADNAKAEVTLDLGLRGTMYNEALSGDFLEELVLARDAKSEILSKGASEVTYRITGTVRANAVSSGEVIVSDEPISVVAGEIRHQPDMVVIPVAA